VQILQDAIRKTFKDPEFAKEFKKLTGDDPTPLTPEALATAIREIPRDRQIIELFKKLVSGEPLPPR
jgi:tripartite-type tricarboxylate transporter receptor subunit TctC